MRLHKFIMAFDEDSALTSASVWLSHPHMRPSLEAGHIFDGDVAAHAALADLIKRAEADGVCEPGHECGRCINWPPRVWEVALEIIPCEE